MRRVAVLAFDGISPFHLSVPSLVFGAVGLDGMRAPYEVVVCAEEPRPITTSAGYSIDVPHGLSAFGDADMVVVPSWRVGTLPTDELLDAVRGAHARGARIVGLCLGAIVVAASGVADGREIATHWAGAEWLTATYPGTVVRSDVLWSDLGDVVTSAGVAAGLDCCLHIVRKDRGSALATVLARSLVLAPHRSGSQAQYIPVPIPPSSDDDPIGRAMVWARENLAADVDLDQWSGEVAMSRRTFTRRFRERTGQSPQQWLLAQRVDHARLLLETGDASIEVIAREAGFGSAVSLRHHFRERLGVSPAAHRAAFGAR
jgi:transcriptional regulator GlxA family with amidase domain